MARSPYLRKLLRDLEDIPADEPPKVVTAARVVRLFHEYASMRVCSQFRTITHGSGHAPQSHSSYHEDTEWVMNSLLWAGQCTSSPFRVRSKPQIKLLIKKRSLGKRREWLPQRWIADSQHEWHSESSAQESFRCRIRSWTKNTTIARSEKAACDKPRAG